MPRKMTSKARAQSKALDLRGEAFWLFAIFMTLLAAAILSADAYGAASRASQLKLESEVWTSEASELGAIEPRVVRLIQEEPSSAFGHYLMAKIFLRRYQSEPSDLGWLRKASEMGQQALELDQVNDYGYIVIAEILDVMGQPQNALKILDRSLNSSPVTGWRTYFTKARLNSDSLHNHTVLTLLDQALGENDAPSDLIAPYVVGVLREEYSSDALTDQLADWQARHPSKFFLHAKAVALAEEGKFQAAHELYQRAQGVDANFSEAIINDGILLYSELGNLEAGRVALERALAIPAELLSKRALSVASSHLGSIMLRKKNTAAANRYFLAAVINADNRPEFASAITQIYRKEGPVSGLAAFIRLLNVQLPGSGLYYALLGETLSEDLKDHKAALVAFSDALTLEPERSDYYTGMGLTYYRMNNFDQALNLFRAAATIDPQDAKAKYNEACMLARLGRGADAITSLREAIALDPRLTDSARGDHDFASINSSQQFVELTAAGSEHAERIQNASLPVGH